MKMMKTACFGVTMTLGILSLVGCTDITAESVRGNMSPEMESIAMTHEQRKNLHARSVDTTSRQIHDDWDALWLIDKPLRLNQYPIPNR